MSYTIKIKNSSGSVQTWVGKAFAINEEYTLEEGECLKYSKDDVFFAAVGAGDAEIGDGSIYYSATDGWNYLTGKNVEVDSEGRQISRQAYGKKGWTYLAHPIEFTTSKENGTYAKDFNNNDRNDFYCKFYDSNNNEIVDAGSYGSLQEHLDNKCVETRVTLKPAYDFEIISGKMDVHTTPTSNVRMWVVGGIIDDTTGKPWEYPASSGVFHVKEFAGGINFKYVTPDKEIETDGRASKFMSQNKTGVPFQTNQFQFIIRHDAGVKQDMMLTMEYFRA